MADLDPPAVRPRPWSRRRGIGFDAALVGVLLLPLLLAPTGTGTTDAATVLLSAVEILPLLVRRVLPTACFALVAAAMAAQAAGLLGALVGPFDRPRPRLTR